jgi:hypothetical protein
MTLFLCGRGPAIEAILRRLATNRGNKLAVFTHDGAPIIGVAIELGVFVTTADVNDTAAWPWHPAAIASIGYLTIFKQATIDAEAMKAAAEEEAKLIVSRAKSDATALIGRRAQAAEEKIAAAERAAIADVRKAAATAAAAAAAQLIAAHHDAKADAALIDQSIAALN